MNSVYNKGVTRLMLALCMMGMSLPACTSDDALSGDNESPKAVKVAISTRAAETNPWTANDVITLQAYAGETTQSASYTFDGTSTWSTEAGLYWSSYKETLDFLGYYPSTTEGLAFTLPTDQSDATKLHAADYMTTDRIYGESNIDANGTEVNFPFNHRMVKIVMNVTYGAEYDGNLPTLSAESILSQGSGVTVTVNTADGSTPTAVTKTGDAVLVQPLIGTNTEGKPCYTALVTPGILTKGSTILMILAVNGEMRQATYNGDLTQLESGKAYSFNVKIGEDIITITDGIENPWGSGWGSDTEL